jgi:hypothetical protein
MFKGFKRVQRAQRFKGFKTPEGSNIFNFNNMTDLLPQRGKTMERKKSNPDGYWEFKGSTKVDVLFLALRKLEKIEPIEHTKALISTKNKLHHDKKKPN